MSTLPWTASSKSADGDRADVSVLIPVGGDEFLAECLESVCNQELGPREILLFVDGRSHWDRSFETAVESIRRPIDVLIVPSEHVGSARARNELVMRAKGKFLAFLDVDDIWEPAYLKRQIENLLAHEGEGHAIGIAGVTHFLSPGVLPSEVPANLEKFLGIQKTIAIPSALVVSRETFDKVGLFDEQFPCSSDVDWVLRANQARVHRLDVNEPLVRKRVHRHCLSLNQTDLADEIMRVIRKNRP